MRSCNPLARLPVVIDCIPPRQRHARRDLREFSSTEMLCLLSRTTPHRLIAQDQCQSLNASQVIRSRVVFASNILCFGVMMRPLRESENFFTITTTIITTSNSLWLYAQ